MLSTQYRLKLEGICLKIANREEVSLEDMIWANKLSSHNASAAKIMRQARRKAENENMTEDNLDGFLNSLDLGGIGHERFGVSEFKSADEIVDFFKRNDVDDEENEGDKNWRRRD
jgi:hypothetical protein